MDGGGHGLARNRAEADKFWSRLGGREPLLGSRVLDVGCGDGSLCVDAALAGAAEVWGIDSNAQRIRDAQAHLNADFRERVGRVHFRNTEIHALDLGGFDVIVSKDAFEHIMDVEGVLSQMARLLAPGGRICLGFGPLYNSPYGDHGRLRAVLPWGHLIFPQAWLLKRRGVTSLADLKLNGHPLSRFLAIIGDSGLLADSLEINCSDRPMARVFAAIARIPALREYFSFNIYCVLRRPDRSLHD